MKAIFVILFLLAVNELSSGESPKEFEGVITYKTTIILKDKNLDINNLYKVFGRERQYYFKKGKFKWVPKDVRLEYEIFDPTISSSMIIDKFHGNDTLFYKDLSEILDTVTKVEKGKQLSILNINCSSATFTVTDENKSDSKLFRTIYYPTDSLVYSTPYYNSLQAMGQSYISRFTNSIPLRMELDSKNQPFSIVYEATKIEWRSLSDSEFKIDETLPSKR